MHNRFRLIKEKVAGRTMLVLTVLSALVAVLIGVGLYLRSQPLLETTSLWTLLSSSEWKPFKGLFGFFPFIMGTLWVTAIAIIIALPLCLLCGIYISEYAHQRVRKIIVPFVDFKKEIKDFPQSNIIFITLIAFSYRNF